MERKEAIEKLRSLQKSTDTEQAHSDADEVLCDLLTSLGYGDVVEEWEAVSRWYA